MSSRTAFPSWARLQVAIVVLAGATWLTGCTDAVAPTTVRTRFVSRASSSTSALEQVPIVEGRVIVHVRPGENADDVARDHGAAADPDLILEGTALLGVEPGSEETTATELQNDPRVEFAEVDYLMALAPCDVGNCQLANDEFLYRRWDLNNTGEIRTGTTTLAVTGKVDADIDWLEMADALGSSPQGEAIVGIIDSGIRGAHQDLVGRVLADSNFAVGYPGNFTDDRIGHGTHVAGVVAARGNNVAGVPGIAYGPNIRLVNAKACELYQMADGSIQSFCPSSSVARAIVWAVDRGAKIINISLGTAGAATGEFAVQQQALQYARQRGALAFCAAGNGNLPEVDLPARFPECNAVGATNWSDQKASYSNYSPKIALSAPGGDGEANPLSSILSTLPSAQNNAYGYMSGTSQATATVSGLAAVLYSVGITNTDDIFARLQETADDLGQAGADAQFGAGRVNAYRALTRRDPGAPPIAHIDPIPHGMEGSPLTFASTGSGDPNGHPVTYRWDFGDGTTSSDPNPTHTYTDDGFYTVTLAVTDESNRTTRVTAEAEINNVSPLASIAVSSWSVTSGETLLLRGTLTDAGPKDGPWQWTIGWGGRERTSGNASSTPATIEESHRFCAAQSYSVRLDVTDKDQGAYRATQLVFVERKNVAIGTVRSLQELLDGGGNLPVVVYSTSAFDATTIDPAKATLGDGKGGDTPVARRADGTFTVSSDDQNGDGRPDLLLYFDRRAILDILNLDESGGWLALSRSIAVVVRASLTDGCTEVEGRWTIGLRR